MLGKNRIIEQSNTLLLKFPTRNKFQHMVDVRSHVLAEILGCFVFERSQFRMSTIKSAILPKIHRIQNAPFYRCTCNLRN